MDGWAAWIVIAVWIVVLVVMDILLLRFNPDPTGAMPLQPRLVVVHSLVVIEGLVGSLISS
jgi:hypothetical protein